MKKLTVILILSALLFSMFACGEQESPAAYLPAIRYDNADLQSFSVLISSSDGSVEADGYGSEHTPAEIITMFVNTIPFTEISSGKIELVNGSDKNVESTITYKGVYTADGEELKTDEAGLSALSAGKYVICARVTEKRADKSFTDRYIFAGIDKKQ